jgi:hypothetical protein
MVAIAAMVTDAIGAGIVIVVALVSFVAVVAW